MKNRKTLLNVSFALIWLGFPILYIAVASQNHLATTLALAFVGVAAAIALAT